METKKRALFCLICMLIFVCLLADSQASLFKNTIPTGKEIKDPYLEQLFAPEFPYESVKVIETKEGKMYVVVKAKETVSEKIRLDYEKNTLRNRGIVVFRSGSPRTNILLISEMRLYRKVSELPYVVEYSEVKGDIIEFDRKRKVESVVRNEGKYLIVLVNKDFGKAFKRVEIYPEKDAGCPEPPFIGKYPNAKSVLCTEKDKLITFIYVSKDKEEDIYNFYKDRLKAHYRKVGFSLPERRWGASGIKVNRLGMEIDVYRSTPDSIGNYWERKRKEGKSIKPPLSLNGIVSTIIIDRGGL